MSSKQVLRALLISGPAILAWSGLWPNGRLNWLMETLPAMVGGMLLVVTYRRFRFSTVSHGPAWFFAIILMIGGQYAYSEVPISNRLRDAFGLSRNHFDRLGHFCQGVIPAMFARELLLRISPLRWGKLLFTVCVALALGISAAYELSEWQYAVIFGGQQADDFLGSQGDIWDAQKDIFMVLCGAVVLLLLLGKRQDRQIKALVAETGCQDRAAHGQTRGLRTVLGAVAGIEKGLP